ncbi:MAG: hypothetical protein AB2728_03705 [Candidatus Thiodiazotropha sp.]|nr:hypothetical protein [Candidatus Thiodiazotropha taylori]MBT3058895.1 hypothetical protein [Candidatus Thiodiazotropha sp. (ex Lucina pensylvanica)]MBV2096073.1 hypothetical protein [Candidatus Thiodiazotropha sp. (ex Codakia orbicularis)]
MSGMIPDIAAAGISAATELEIKAAMVGYQWLCKNRSGPQVPEFHFFYDEYHLFSVLRVKILNPFE